MQIYRRILLLLCAVILFPAVNLNATNQNPDHQAGKDPYVIMLSMDGFRWDYSERVPTPNLDFIAANGSKVDYMIPAFPTKTFPNHYSMATGLYPDNHGIVNNNFYCSRLDMTYRLGDRKAVENGIFYGGEPIWVSAEKQGITAASFFWVGSEAPVQGTQPTYWKRYQNDIPFESRIDTVIAWLQLPIEKRPRLITLYFNEPDSQGHSTGPDSPEIDRLVKRLDHLVGELYRRLNQLPFSESINLIITSDHGMSAINTHNYVNLSDYVERDWFEKIHGGNPLYSLRPKPEMKDSVYAVLKNIEHIHVWKTNEIPPRLHYGKNPRTLDMVVLADSTWSVGWGSPSERYYSGGSHGWDPAFKDMHTIFYAIGPAFKANHRHPPIEIVDIYPLIAHILHLRPAQIDGQFERVRAMLIE